VLKRVEIGRLSSNGKSAYTKIKVVPKMTTKTEIFVTECGHWETEAQSDRWILEAAQTQSLNQSPNSRQNQILGFVK
jgi:hypothetical protein